MSDLVRFGVAMDRSLLVDFDRRIAARGYENRSEALRDLVRADLTRAAWETGAHVAATITLVYTSAVRELVVRLTEAEGELADLVVSTLRVRLDAARMLEVLVVRGVGSRLTDLAGRLAGMKGVLSCELTLASTLGPVSPGGASPLAHPREAAR